MPISKPRKLGDKLNSLNAAKERCERDNVRAILNSGQVGVNFHL